MEFVVGIFDFYYLNCVVRVVLGVCVVVDISYIVYCYFVVVSLVVDCIGWVFDYVDWIDVVYVGVGDYELIMDWVMFKKMWVIIVGVCICLYVVIVVCVVIEID